MANTTTASTTDKQANNNSNKSNNNDKSATNDKSNETEDKYKRFENDGVVFKAKLIGSELVMEPRGDKMCQSSIKRLKAIIKGTNEHKKRVLLKIGYYGVKVYDEKTNEILHHHEVPKISYIANDDSDPRTFGYVCDLPNNGHQFICFKTSGPAINVMSVISALFEAVLAKKSGEAEKVQKAETTKPSGATTTTTKGQDSIDLVSDSGIIDANLSFLSDTTHHIMIPEPPRHHNRSLVYNHSSVSLGDAATTRQFSFSSPSNQSDGYVDRYSVFNDIDNLPSIFESTSLGTNSQQQQQQLYQRQQHQRQKQQLLHHQQQPLLHQQSQLLSSNQTPFQFQPLSQQQLQQQQQQQQQQYIYQHQSLQRSFAGFPNIGANFNTISNMSNNNSNSLSNISGGASNSNSSMNVSRNNNQIGQNLMYRQKNPFDDDFFA